jgi:hypothetical protein
LVYDVGKFGEGDGDVGDHGDVLFQRPLLVADSGWVVVKVDLAFSPVGAGGEDDEVLEGVFAAGAINGHKIELAGAKEALNMAVKGAEGGRVGEVGLEGADQVVEESWVEVAGVSGRGWYRALSNWSRDMPLEGLGLHLR